MRSGEYRQAKGQLKGTVYDNEDNEHVGYCCLGVLCEVAGPGTFEGDVYVIPSGAIQLSAVDREYVDTYGDGGDVGPIDLFADLEFDSVRDYFGLPKDVHNDLARFNDDGDSFATLADYIEANL